MYVLFAKPHGVVYPNLYQEWCKYRVKKAAFSKKRSHVPVLKSMKRICTRLQRKKTHPFPRVCSTGIGYGCARVTSAPPILLPASISISSPHTTLSSESVQGVLYPKILPKNYSFIDSQ
ncbi:hypothetical protein L2E82_17674 [Cichorium intybus]|uniref:Uncharacterized protein n=1 Tax=Cichorium intybus TaxID=13427 RepID=A0ACB9F9K4_CICIN|nr:hypothetical protein L2E82_17674 [Cichorium intybus]